jgi:hypothetical protein
MVLWMVQEGGANGTSRVVCQTELPRDPSTEPRSQLRLLLKCVKGDTGGLQVVWIRKEGPVYTTGIGWIRQKRNHRGFPNMRTGNHLANNL